MKMTEAYKKGLVTIEDYQAAQDAWDMRHAERIERLISAEKAGDRRMMDTIYVEMDLDSVLEFSKPGFDPEIERDMTDEEAWEGFDENIDPQTETHKIIDIDTAIKTMEEISETKTVTVITCNHGAYGFNHRVDGQTWEFGTPAKNNETIIESAERIASTYGNIVSMTTDYHSTSHGLEYVYIFKII